jgi:hypothetical protein
VSTTAPWLLAMVDGAAGDDEVAPAAPAAPHESSTVQLPERAGRRRVRAIVGCRLDLPQHERTARLVAAVSALLELPPITAVKREDVG